MKTQGGEIGRGRNAWAEGGLASAVVEALPDTTNDVRSIEPMQSLGDGRRRKVRKIRVAPVALAAFLDARAHRLGYWASAE